LADVLARGDYARGRRVLEICTGSGLLALAAAEGGAESVTATDLSWRSVATAWLNTRRCGAQVRVRRGDLFAPIRGHRFDLILANPPYVPSEARRAPRHRMARCWDGGITGRAFIDRICAEAPRHLSEAGMLLIVHSSICDEQQTLRHLEQQQFEARVLASTTEGFGPVLRSRAAMLERHGLIRVGQRHEQLIVIGGWLTASAGVSSAASLPPSDDVAPLELAD
jgi:release factor glutamine methyltransferase